MNHDRTVGVLGGTSLVGRPLLPLLAAAGWRTVACTRAACPPEGSAGGGAIWCHPGDPRPGGETVVATWLALCPLWALPGHLPWLESLAIRRLVALSSTSLLTKRDSPDPDERRVAAALAAAEETLRIWSQTRGVELCLLRPTMIYDGVRDGNVAAIAAFVRRHGWFPVAGPARGRRQPVHAECIAAACVAALGRDSLAPAYTLSGGEPLLFRDLVATVFAACKLPPRIIHVPRPLWAMLLPLARSLGIAAGASNGMAARMNDDLVFDHADAVRDLGFRPRPFAVDRLAAEA
ncbi:MAG: NAD(P)-dependent oxidoreductase [Planctomycetia bacterium]|nr:NAD(P)-dependent oxidoreductase [Planctomycetia bacterium]